MKDMFPGLLFPFLMLLFLITGCSSGSGSDSDTPTAPVRDLSISQSHYDFGDVTVGNSAVLQITIHNEGTNALTIHSLELSDNIHFSIDAGDCGATLPYTISSGSDCILVLTFTPTAAGDYNEIMSIHSDDEDNPEFIAFLTGSATAVSALTTIINQMNATRCPTITAYISVTDQDGFAVTDLLSDDFTVTENADGVSASPGLSSFDFAQNTALGMATTIVMDYSSSMRNLPEKISSMENAAIDFINRMGPSDYGEIIKFGAEVELFQPFTVDKALLMEAVQEANDFDTGTSLYAAIYEAVEHAAAGPAERRAVVVLTDGYNTRKPEFTADGVISLAVAEQVPVFTIGVGLIEAGRIPLQSIAESTGGQFFETPSSYGIRTVYSKISKILNNQYVLTYDTPFYGVAGGIEATVSVADDVPAIGVIGDVSDPMAYEACP